MLIFLNHSNATADQSAARHRCVVNPESDSNDCEAIRVNEACQFVVALVGIMISQIFSSNTLEDKKKCVTDLLFRRIIRAWPASGRAFCHALVSKPLRECNVLGDSCLGIVEWVVRVTGPVQNSCYRVDGTTPTLSPSSPGWITQRILITSALPRVIRARRTRR